MDLTIRTEDVIARAMERGRLAAQMRLGHIAGRVTVTYDRPRVPKGSELVEYVGDVVIDDGGAVLTDDWLTLRGDKGMRAFPFECVRRVDR